MSIKLATHLYRNRHGTFNFRLVIPQDLRDHVKQREFRFSLNTEQRHQAIIAALPFVADLPHLISDLRHMADDKKTVERDYFRKWLQEKRRSIDLLARCEELVSQLDHANLRLANSVPRDDAERAVTSAFTVGQLKGNREFAAKLEFPWSPERTALSLRKLRCDR